MPFIMPFICNAYSGRDLGTKKKTAQAIIKAASETMGIPESAFTVAYKDIERGTWEKDVARARH